MPLTNVHFHLPALPEPSTRQVQQELLALPGVLEVRLDQSSGDLAVRYDTGGTSRELIRERLNRLGCFFVQTSLEQLTACASRRRRSLFMYLRSGSAFPPADSGPQ